MSKAKRMTLEVQGIAITILDKNDQDYISLTDIARYRNSQDPFAVINNWMRGHSTIEFLGLWEKLSNPGFKPLEFEGFKNEAGSHYNARHRYQASHRHRPRHSRGQGARPETVFPRPSPRSPATAAWSPPAGTAGASSRSTWYGFPYRIRTLRGFDTWPSSANVHNSSRHRWPRRGPAPVNPV